MAYEEMKKFGYEKNWANNMCGLRKAFYLSLNDTNVQTMSHRDWRHLVKSSLLRHAFLKLKSESAINKKTNHLEFVLLNSIAYGWGGGGGLAHAIRLAARTPEPFHLESPKFLTSLLCLLDTLWQNFRKIYLLICQGGCCNHLWNTRLWKISDRNIFIFVQNGWNF